MMSFLTLLPFWKIVGYVLYLAIYFFKSGGDMYQYPPENMMTVIFKALPIFHLMLMLWHTDNEEKQFPRYKRNMLLAMAFSMLGDAMMVWRITLFLPAVAFFAVAHLFYIGAFRMKPFGGGPTLVSMVIISAFSFFTIAQKMTEEETFMHGMVFIYTGLIGAMVWRAVVNFQTWGCPSTFCACVGACSFAISDYLIAFDRWRNPIEGAAFYVMVAYFFGQLMLALSATCYTPRKLVKQD